MKSIEPLIALWTPANEPRSFRVRFTDGGIVVLSTMFTRQGAGGAMSAGGVLLRVLRASATAREPVGEELIFDLNAVRDVADQNTGEMVFPPERAFKRSSVTRFFGNNHAKQRIYGRVIGVCIGVAGVIMTTAGVIAQREHLQMARWPLTQGTILVNEIQAFRTPVGRKSGNRWFPAVKYEYEVDGRRYASTRFFSVEWDDGFATADDARAYTSQFRVGEPVMVHYDPTYPAESYLVTGDTVSGRVFVVLGVMALIGSILWWWLADRAIRRLEEREESET